MKRLSYFAMTALLMAGLTMPVWSQGKPPQAGKTDPCAAEKAAVKAAGKTNAATKAKADLKACTTKTKADAAAAKKNSTPAKK